MKIISWNVNGLRAAARHGLLDAIRSTDPDILCLQEIKAQPDDLPPELLAISGYESYFNPAQIKGYAGTAIYTKIKPLAVEFDILSNQQIKDEGRTMLLEFEHFSLLNIYVPHGSRDKSKLIYKLRFYALLQEFVTSYTNKPLIITGDFNVAQADIDLARPKQNRSNTMFTPEERSALKGILELGFVDTFRHLHKNQVTYSWWPYLANARERNIGWRIDYALASRHLVGKVKEASILTDIYGSDHCPTLIDVKI